jgi:hypothetical protein
MQILRRFFLSLAMWLVWYFWNFLGSTLSRRQRHIWPSVMVGLWCIFNLTTAFRASPTLVYSKVLHRQHWNRLKSRYRLLKSNFRSIIHKNKIICATCTMVLSHSFTFGIQSRLMLYFCVITLLHYAPLALPFSNLNYLSIQKKKWLGDLWFVIRSVHFSA